MPRLSVLLFLLLLPITARAEETAPSALPAAPVAPDAPAAPVAPATKHDGASTLRLVEPACNTPEFNAPCAAAAEMLSRTAPGATEVFIDAMDRLSGKRDAALVKRLENRADRGTHHYGHSRPGDTIGTSIDIAAGLLDIGVNESNLRAEKKARNEANQAERGRTLLVRVLSKIYDAASDEYSGTMKPRLADYSPDSDLWLSRFATVHDKATADVGASATPVGFQTKIAEAKATSDAAYRPTGKGPVPFEINRRWKTVEAGKKITVVTKDGRTLSGTVGAVSTRGIVVKTESAEEYVEASELKDIR